MNDPPDAAWAQLEGEGGGGRHNLRYLSATLIWTDFVDHVDGVDGGCLPTKGVEDLQASGVMTMAERQGWTSGPPDDTR